MKVTPGDLRNAWNVNRGEMLACVSLDVKGRFALAMKRLGEVDDLARWVAAIKRAAASEFCTGLVPGKEGSEPFVGSFDWLMRPETLTLIEEGQFDHRGPQPPEVPQAHDVLRYWQGDRPRRWEPAGEEFLRCQVQGVLTRVKEQHEHRKLPVNSAEMRWIDAAAAVEPDTRYTGHPWATPEQVKAAETYVLNARKAGTLPTSIDDFGKKPLLRRFGRG